MNHTDYLLIGVILLALIWAVRTSIRDRKQGKNCAGDCMYCNHRCEKMK